MNPFHAQNDETNDSIEFKQPYPFLQLLEIGTALIPAVVTR
jgi:hypothetical protein